MKLSKTNIESKLQELINLNSENEIVEFKEAKNTYDFTKLGKYFSALGNEANLMNEKEAWLIFGVENKSHKIVGTQFRNNYKLNNLKKEIADKTSNRITFIEIHDLDLPEGRVIMFQIPPAPRGLPVSFEGHYYGRDHESLVALNPEEYDRIRNQGVEEDWSVKIIHEASLTDLDLNAVNYARERFMVKFPDMVNEVKKWDNITFLNKAKLTIKSKITNTAVLLLGKSESEYLITPSMAKIRWILKTAKNEEKDYEIFTPPLLMAIDRVFNKIRNLKYRYLPHGTLFPNELLQYEPFNIREALNNCVAHNDYTKGSFINVVEYEDERLIFSNYATFTPGTIEKVIFQDAPEEKYRNRFLANAMFQLGLVDTRGGGIKKIYVNQIKRFFPLPDYELNSDKTKVTITGKILNLDFANLLTKHPDLSLSDIFLLDKVQKRKDLSANELKYLKKKKYVEGRKPNIFLSHSIVEKTKDKELIKEYEQNKGLSKDELKNMILSFIKSKDKVYRTEIDQFIWNKLPNILTHSQKLNKIRNIIQELRRDDKIFTPEYSCWIAK